MLAFPQMALAQEHVRHVMVLGVDHQTLDRTDPAIAGVHLVSAVHLHLADRHPVDDHRLVMAATTQGHPKPK
ncbi:MAG TPA: hypothetical protein VHV76_15365 [Mycobacteriales bacterium]|nr:hypothetical protein [Mycobacteriales bacterium]